MKSFFIGAPIVAVLLAAVLAVIWYGSGHPEGLIEIFEWCGIVFVIFLFCTISWDLGEKLRRKR